MKKGIDNLIRLALKNDEIMSLLNSDRSEAIKKAKKHQVELSAKELEVLTGLDKKVLRKVIKEVKSKQG